MPLDWSPFVASVRAHRRFLLTTHVRPDGDGIGSMLALHRALGSLGKEVASVVASAFPARYGFLDPDGVIQRFESPTGPAAASDAVIVLDTGAWAQLGDFGPYLRSLDTAKIVIDHHVTQDDLGAVRFVDVSAEATGRLVYEAIAALDIPLSAEIAGNLFVALAMDTGWFRHSNATAATFELAAELVRAGAVPELFYDRLFEENTLPRLKLMGLVLDRLEMTTGGRVAYSTIYRGDYSATGSVPPDSEDLVNFTRSLTGVKVGLLFMEQPRGGVKVSFRSRAGVDVARIAESFGGGGHRQAAGAIVQEPVEVGRAKVLEAVAEAVESAG